MHQLACALSTQGQEVHVVQEIDAVEGRPAYHIEVGIIRFNRFLVGDGDMFNKEEYDRIDTPMPESTSWSYGGHRKDSDEERFLKKSKHYNAFLSHKLMAKKALEDGDEKVLFLEMLTLIFLQLIIHR